MGGSKGGQANSSGIAEALVSAAAANQAYQLGNDQLNWTKQVWNQEQPTIQNVVNADVTAQQQQNQLAAQLQPYEKQALQTQVTAQQQEQQFAQEQQQLYQQTYEPLQQQYVQQTKDWASPAQQTINAAAAETNVNAQSEAQRQSAQEQLESFGINPGSTRYAGLDIGSRTMQAAAAAGAGTQAIQQTKLQGLGLEAGAIEAGQGLPNQVAGLSSTGVGAGTAGAGGTQSAYLGGIGAGAAGAGALQSNLATGSGALSAPASWYNTGASNMNTYVNAVGGYNQAQLGYAQVGAGQWAGLGALTGGLLGGSALGMGGWGSPGSSGLGIFQEGGPTELPARSPGGNTTTPGVTANSSSAIPPQGTPGGAIPTHASPSGGQQVDDVPARLTVGEFVMPKDVVEWEGQKYFYNQIDKSRMASQEAKSRSDIGGERGTAIPAQPTFVSRPAQPNPSQPHPRALQGGGAITTYQSPGAIPTERYQHRRAIG